jgi:hypothetical protein
MSIEIDWEQVKAEFLKPERVCEAVGRWLQELATRNEAFPIAGFCNIRLAEFSLGDQLSCAEGNVSSAASPTLPTVELVDVVEARDEFVSAAGKSRSIHSPPPHARVSEHNMPINAQAVLIDATTFLFEGPAAPIGGGWLDVLVRDGLEAVLLLRMSLDNVRIVLEADAALNLPSPAFLSLPFKLTLTRLHLVAAVLVALVGEQAFLALTRHPVAPELELQLAVEIGDPERQVLRNVSKIEKFLAEQAKLVLTERLMLPKFVQFRMSSLKASSSSGASNGSSPVSSNKDPLINR